MSGKNDSSSFDSDDDVDILHGLPWQYHPLRAFLLEKMVLNEFPADDQKFGPQYVWNKYCDAPCFEGMEYDAAFRRRLLDVRKKFVAGKSRAEDDLKSFMIAKKNHPAPLQNHRGEPQWNGSDAQRLLRLDMDASKHIGIQPMELWKSQPEFKLFHLTTFRDHLHQEIQTRKYLLTLKAQEKARDKKIKTKAKQQGRKKRDLLGREKDDS